MKNKKKTHAYTIQNRNEAKKKKQFGMHSISIGSSVTRWWWLPSWHKLLHHHSHIVTNEWFYSTEERLDQFDGSATCAFSTVWCVCHGSFIVFLSSIFFFHSSLLLWQWQWVIEWFRLFIATIITIYSIIWSQWIQLNGQNMIESKVATK